MKAKILVVDDEADLQLLIKQKFRRQIREQEYEFLFAENGIKALEVIGENPDVDMVLSDINMPEMDGLTLLVRIGELSPILKSVIVSAYGDMDNIRMAMNRGAFDFLTKPIDFKDLEVTMEKTLIYVASLKETLKAVRENDILRMYVDSSVLQFMTQETFEKSLMTSETINGSVVFMDMCGFTSISEKEPPDLVVKLINKYFDVMVKEIIAQGGLVDKFMGDAVMAVFRGEYHLDRAVESSLAVRNHINSFKEELSNQSGYHPNVSIGINSGEMVSGNIGSAALKRLDYTVIGDVVNVAQRLQSIAKPGQVVVAESGYQQIKEAFKCNPVGEVSLKNKSNPVMIYEVVE
ncbi:adenylate/guanylate cyclase domain-containing response regulator [Dyadobacter arcticus]|uniref:Class 3 adenylate cyclase/ActR/RegA family two-component response regulator n=1 Tax=Dyadobacter arcticus TaxID=1078754 RepID=A0ABX0UQ40_9BACT|nr:adenylate/guanylate cyclase domain-containing response regulator [Dyadobacter arcticus]NIJ54069.1 class 3 adenylate cyclase/ActR/RegA family two-component response regulator [Dyadobacter arcticus]